MPFIRYIDRKTYQVCQEKVYGKWALSLLYGKGKLSAFFAPLLLPLFAKFPLFSWLYGWWQSLPITKSKIKSFISKFEIDESEFLDPVDSFGSFNDFFIRKLKPEARPIAEGDFVAVLPADARYLFYQDLSQIEGFLVKGERFCLKELLQDDALAARYEGGSMVLARLCPTDYHRFHFPVDCIPGKPRLINGYLYSVNPIAIKKNIDIFTKNKRKVTALETQHFGTIQYIEVGATNVGSINETFKPHSPCYKGSEKGYFSFGASSLVLLFEPGAIVFDNDLVEATAHEIEILGLMGQSMGEGRE